MILKNTRLTKTALLFLILIVFSSPVYAGNVQLPQTGQAATYSPGDDGDIPSGVPWPNPRFSSGGIGCLTDNLTGLTWNQNGNLPNGRITWDQALAYTITLNGGAGICGHNDWRLPNVNELATLTNANQANSATWLNAAGQGFIGMQSGQYWSSTTYAGLTSSAWTVDMQVGVISYSNKGNIFYVIPVRGTTSGPAPVPATGQTVHYLTTTTALVQDGDLQQGVPLPSTRFQVNGDGTAADELTGLVWLQDANCIMTNYPSFDNGGVPATSGRVIWERALDFIDGMNNSLYPLCDGGHHDWRLPNKNELRSLINYESNSSNYFASLVAVYGFSNIQDSANRYWSSTSSAFEPLAAAWTLYVGSNEIGTSGKTYARYLWPVRSIRGIQVSPRSFNYGGVYEGDTKVRTFTVYNEGSADVAISSLSYGLAAYAALDDHCSGALLGPLETCTFDLAFKPLNTGGYGSLFILSDDTNRPLLEVLLGGDILTCSLQRDQGVQIANGSCVPDPTNCDTIQSAYNSATAADTIRVRMITFTEPNNFNLGKTITLEGGYDCSFAASTYYSTIGSLTISSGKVTIANIVIQ